MTTYLYSQALAYICTLKDSGERGDSEIIYKTIYILYNLARPTKIISYSSAQDVHLHIKYFVVYHLVE